MSNFMPKMLNFLGFDTEDEYQEDYYMEEKEPVRNEYDDMPVLDRFASRRSSRVVKLHETAPQQMRVVVIQPENFEEAQDITDHLKERKPIIVNLEAVEREVARHIVDFLSGAVYALDGEIQKISNGIFLVTPHNVGILDEDATGTKSGFSWNN